MTPSDHPDIKRPLLASTQVRAHDRRRLRLPGWLLLALPITVFAACAPVEARSAGKRPPPAAHAPQWPALTVREPDGLARTQWPVSTGVPFARGQLRPETVLALTELGAPRPLQTRVLSRWDDGSVRWLLADFAADLPAHAERSFTLAPGGMQQTKHRVDVREHSDGVAVDTGPLRFNIPRTRFAILEDVRLNGRPMLAGPLRAFLTLDRRSEPSPPRTITVRESGPLRAQVELRGELAEGFDYVVRVHAYAGQPFVRVLFTFIATGPATSASVREIAVEAPLPPGESRSYQLGIEHERAAVLPLPKKGITLVQDDNVGFRLNGRRRIGHAAGWIDTQGKAGGVAIAARYFWQEYAKGFRLQPGLLAYDLWPLTAPPITVGVGAAKTHEFVVSFFEQTPPAMPSARSRPLIAHVDPAWITASGALPNAVAPDVAASFLRRLDEAHRRVDARTDQEKWDEAAGMSCPPAEAERPRTGAYGMLNWGDWNYPGYHDTTKGCDAWGNLEYDLTQVDALAYAAHGTSEFIEAMTVAARHFMDVDVIHAQPAHPRWIGMNHPKNPRHFNFERSGIDLGHTWTEGLLSYYYLTGDDRALEAARGIADYLAQRLRLGVVRGNPRQWGWPQIALLAVWRATGDERYRTAAVEYARGGMAAYASTDIGNWKLGILADALADTHAATHDPAIEQWLRTFAAAVVAKPDGDLRLYPAVAYVARLSGDAALSAAARRTVDRIEFGNWAKPFTIAGRTGFRILSLLSGPVSAPRATP